MPPAPTGTASSTVSSPHQRGSCVTRDEPTLAHHSHPKLGGGLTNLYVSGENTETQRGEATCTESRGELVRTEVGTAAFHTVDVSSSQKEVFSFFQ